MATPTDPAIQPLIAKLEKDDSLFARAVIRLHRAGVRNPFQAAALQNRALFSAWQQKQEGMHTEKERRTDLAEPEYIEALAEIEPESEEDDLVKLWNEITDLGHLEEKKRPAAILRLAKNKPEIYNAARKRGLL